MLKVRPVNYETKTVEQLEKDLDYAFMARRYAKEIAYGVGGGRIVNHKGYAKRNVAEVRAEALQEVNEWSAKIDAIYAELIKREGAVA